MTAAKVASFAIAASTLLSACTRGARQPDTDTVTSQVPSDQPGSDTPAVQSGPRQPDTTTARAAVRTDTLFGQVSEMGADPTTWLAIVPRGGRAVRLAGRAEPLRNVTGAEVWVSGRHERGENVFRVDVFEVRRVNGRQVDDGVVMVQGDDVRIRTRSGTTRTVPNAPPTMRGMPGARVWVTHPEPGRAPSFGVVAPAPGG